jgi:hypothetical protein
MEAQMDMGSDLARELDFWRSVQTLNLIEEIIFGNPRWDDVAAQVAEHRPDLTPFEAQLEVKRILIATDERGSPELAEAFVAGARRRDADP